MDKDLHPVGLGVGVFVLLTAILGAVVGAIWAGVAIFDRMESAGIPFAVCFFVSALPMVSVIGALVAFSQWVGDE